MNEWLIDGETRKKEMIMNKDILEIILTELVEHADELQVNELRGAQTINFEIICHKSDIGRILGKGGVLINALRTLFIALEQGRMNVYITVVE